MAPGRVPVFASAGAPADGPVAAQLHLHLGVGCGRLGLGSSRNRSLRPFRRGPGLGGSAGEPLLIASLAHGAQIIHLAHRRFTTRTLASARDISRQAPANVVGGLEGPERPAGEASQRLARRSGSLMAGGRTRFDTSPEPLGIVRRLNGMTQRPTAHVRVVASCFLVAAGFVSLGCDGTEPREATADCSTQVRFDGRVYTSYGYTDRKATRIGVADRAECHDVGVDAKGSVFPADPRQVAVWSFEDYPPHEVLGVRFEGTSFAVFVEDSVSEAESGQILRALTPD